MPYACKSCHCTQEFPTQRGLTIHRTSCEHYKRHEAASLLKRREAAALKQAKRQDALERVRHLAESVLILVRLWSRFNVSANDSLRMIHYLKMYQWSKMKFNLHQSLLLQCLQHLGDHNGTTVYQRGMRMYLPKGLPPFNLHLFRKWLLARLLFHE
jgi:hypothetical protein